MMMDIERLKELKGLTEQLYQDGNVPLAYCDDILETINEAIARQSAEDKNVPTSEEVAEAIEQFQSEYVDDFEGYPATCEKWNRNIDLAIAALQAYQPKGE